MRNTANKQNHRKYEGELTGKTGNVISWGKSASAQARPGPGGDVRELAGVCSCGRGRRQRKCTHLPIQGPELAALGVSDLFSNFFAFLVSIFH